MRRVMTLVLAGAVLFSTGLGGAGAVGRSAARARVTLRWGVWMKEQMPALRAIAAEFERSHPDIRIHLQLTSFDKYWPARRSEAKRNALPDVFAMNVPSFPYFATHRFLTPLNRLITRDHIALAVYPPSVIASSTFKGMIYALPKDFDVIGLWYNRSLFDAANVSYPDGTWTWKTLYAAAKRLTNHARGTWGIAAQLKDQEGYYNTIYQAGGYVISANRKRSGFDDPRSIRGLQFWTDLIRKGYSPKAGAMTDPDAKNNLFLSGKVAMIFGGDWLARTFATDSYLKGKVDVAPLPRDARRATVLQTTGWVIPVHTRHAGEAWTFVKFLGSARAAYIQADAGFVIPAYVGTESIWTSTWPQLHLKSFLTELNYSVPYPASNNSDVWQTMANTYLSQAWTGKTSVKAAATIIARKMNADLRAE